MEILNFFDLDDVGALFYYVTMILISFLQKNIAKLLSNFK